MSSTCVQGSMASPLGGYQQHILSSNSPARTWHYPGPVVPKTEPMEEERNDSGINSDYPSSSPGSDRSEHPNLNSPQNSHVSMPTTHASESTYTSTPSTQMQYHTWYRNNFTNSPLENKESVPQQMQLQNLAEDTWNKSSSVITSRKDSECRTSISENSQDYQPSPSPKQESTSGDETMSEFDDQGIRIPKVNSHGKIKVHKCKQCEFVAYTKIDFWEHSKVHIKGDKILKCPKCPFVTEYKHHLEYHLLNHAGAKPFKCDHCDYSCVNKSMLNSHLKSHSKIYQYRCANCLYETKYCHSLKLHLRKYNHKPAMVLNPDGTPNPLPIIDVYGTRRGPKLKKHSTQPDASVSPKPLEQQLPFNPLSQLMANPTPQLPFAFPFGGFPPNPDFIQNFNNILKERLQEMANQYGQTPQGEGGVLDLSKQQIEQHSSDEEDNSTTTMFSNVEVVENKDASDTTLTEDTKEEELSDTKNNNNNDDKFRFSCQYCSISFGEEVLYRIHMGYHGYSNPFTCNMCGEECKDKVKFFLHIARAAH